MLKEQVDSHLQSELAKNIYDIKGWIDTQSQAVIIISDIIYHTCEKEDITRNLLQSYITNKNISDIYIGFNDGEFLSGRGWNPDQGYDPRNRPWYQEVMNAGELNTSKVYYDFTSKQYAVAIGIPLKDRNGDIIGVLSEDILLNTFYEQVLNIEVENSGYAYLLDVEGNILCHRDENLIGQNLNELIKNDNTVDFSENKSGKGNYLYNGMHKIVVYDQIGDTDWILALAVDEGQVYKPLSKLLWIYLLIAIATLFLSIILCSIFIKNIIKRLKLLSNASVLISQGKFDTDIECLGSDEIGDVSRAFNRMKSEIKETISELNSSKMNYEELMENTADAIYSVNKEGYLITGNTVFLNTFKIESDAIGNEIFANLVRHSELGAILILLGEEVMEKKQLINRKIDKIENYYYNVTLSPILDKNREEVKGVTIILHDASDLESSRNHLEWITHHDLLTGLANRFKLMEDMDTNILKAKTTKNQFAVLFIDLDDFKNINDTLGYSTGDIVLTKIGSMLCSHYISYRIGADEFALVIDEFESLLQLEQRIDVILKMLHHSFEIELNTIYNSATIGVVIYPDHFSNINEMMIRADAALNYAKTKKRSGVQFYDYSISVELEERVLLEKGLRKALDNNEFILYYQPIMNQAGKAIKGFEALIRWRKGDGTILNPIQFMPIAENMALIHDLGLWIIEQAIKDLKKFQKKGNQSLTMAINLSANQIKPLDFYNKVIEIIDRSGVNPHNIEFEITESVLIESLELVKVQFQSLIDLGVKIALDDFGTGYSSLNYLQHFPFQILKIDKSFVDYIRQDNNSRSLVEHIIDIAHRMEMEVVAEGVENELQKNYLIEKKCDYFQGYLFSKPIPEEEVYLLVSSYNLQ